MAGRETVALRLLLPPLDHLPAAGDGPGVVLHQHPAQHVHGRQLAQPGWRRAVIDRLQQRVPVPGVGDRQLIALRLGRRRMPGGHRRAVAAGEVAHADPLSQPVRMCHCQRLQHRPHALAGQLQPAQRRDRRDHVGGIGALLPARLDQVFGRQPFQQRVQRRLLQPGVGDPVPELREHRVVEARVIERQPEQVLPVDPGPHRLGCLPVGELLRPLQDGHQRQPRRRPARAAPDAERSREILIMQPLAQAVADQPRQRPGPLPLVLRRDHRRDQRIRLRPRGRLHGHHIPDSAAGTRGRNDRSSDHGQHHSPNRAR